VILPSDFDFTQGNLQDYVDCPYRFYLRYIIRVKWPALVVDDALQFEQRSQAGARFHRMIQQYFLGVPESSITAMADEDPLFEVSTWWESFLTHVPPWLVGKRWVESTLITNLAGHRLVAKCDLILADDHGGLTIFDWKTTQKVPRVDWLLERIQTRLYRMALTNASPALTGASAVDPQQVKINFWFASHPQSPVTFPYNQSDYAHDKADLAQLIREISSAQPDAFERTRNIKHCRFCVYRSHCDRGVKAGALADFDDFGFVPEDVDEEHPFEDIPEIAL